MRFLSILSLPLLAAAADLEFFFTPTQALPNPASLTSSTRASLSSIGPAFISPISQSNLIIFSSIPPGSYLLSVTSQDVFFENLRVDILADPTTGAETVTAWTTFRGNEWDNKGEVRGEGEAKFDDAVRIEVKALAGKQHYQERPSFGLQSIIKNPMILLMIFSLLLVIGMPMLLDNLDPETKKELEEMQRGSNKATSSSSSQASSLTQRDFANEFASWMSGSSGKAPVVENAK